MDVRELILRILCGYNVGLLFFLNLIYNKANNII